MDEKVPMNNLENMTLPKDSGETRNMSNGTQRDANLDKGRWDLLPGKEMKMVLELEATSPPIDYDMASVVFTDEVSQFMEDHDIRHLAQAIRACHNGLDEYKDFPIEYMFLDVSKLYQAGALKYKENNWKNGMPVKWCIDSGGRHFYKARIADFINRGLEQFKNCDKKKYAYFVKLYAQRPECFDEPHYRGPVWNLLCAMWTATNKPEFMKDLVVIEKA